MEIRDLKNQVADLATTLFRLGFPVGSSDDDVQELLCLWSSIVALDSYCQGLEPFARDRRNVRVEEFIKAVREISDEVSDLAQRARGLKDCAHRKRATSLGATKVGCKMCEMQLKYISVRIQYRAAWLRNKVRQDFSDTENFFLRFTPSFQNEMRDESGLPTKAQRILMELEGIQSNFHEKRSNYHSGNKGISETDYFDTDYFDTGSEPESEPDVCLKCKAPSDIQTKLEECQLAYKKAIVESKELKNKLAGRLFGERNFEEAAKLYEDLCAMEKSDMESYKSEENHRAFNETEIKYLHFRSGLVEVLIKLNRFEEGYDIAKETLQRVGELECGFEDALKRSHRQYCLLLRLLERWDAAKEEHRRVWEHSMMLDPEWALENGFQLGLVLSKAHDYELAAIYHRQVYDESKKHSSLRSTTTIESAEQVVISEEILASRGGGDNERIDKVLEEVWEARCSEPPVKLLALGHKLGVRLLQRNNYARAASVHHAVWTCWTRRDSQFGQKSPETLSSAEFLFKSYFDGANYGEAARVGRWIYEAREKAIPEDHHAALVALHSLGLALFRGRELRDALEPLKESWERGKGALGEDDLFTLENGFDYGRILAEIKDTSKAEHVLKNVWDKSKERMDRESDTEGERTTLCSYGISLASVLETQGKYWLASRVYGEVLGKGVLQSAEELRCEYRSARCQYKLGKHAESLKRLVKVWNQRDAVWTRGSEDYLEAGYYYGCSLMKASKYTQAEEVLLEIVGFLERKYREEDLKNTRYYKKWKTAVNGVNKSRRASA